MAVTYFSPDGEGKTVLSKEELLVKRAHLIAEIKEVEKEIIYQYLTEKGLPDWLVEKITDIEWNEKEFSKILTEYGNKK